MKCRACNREAGNAFGSRSSSQLSPEFCTYHAQAYEKLKLGYEEWLDAYGTISWEEYLGRVLKRKEVGSWVKDLIMLELEDKGKVGFV